LTAQEAYEQEEWIPFSYEYRLDIPCTVRTVEHAIGPGVALRAVEQIERRELVAWLRRTGMMWNIPERCGYHYKAIAE
jgi:hypothetical protein